MAGSPIRSAHLNKMEFVKWKAATMARRLQIQTSDWKVGWKAWILNRPGKPWRRTFDLFCFGVFAVVVIFVGRAVESEDFLDHYPPIRRGYLLVFILVDYGNSSCSARLFTLNVLSLLLFFWNQGCINLLGCRATIKDIFSNLRRCLETPPKTWEFSEKPDRLVNVH